MPHKRFEHFDFTCSYSYFTMIVKQFLPVEPALKDHSRELLKEVSYSRWSLNIGVLSEHLADNSQVL